jgi:tetratricopeptide (TPR) repeat protein
VSAGRDEEAVSVYRAALERPLDPLHRAKLTMELGWLHHVLRLPPTSAAGALAEEAIGLLAGEPVTPRVAYGRGAAQALLASLQAVTDPAGAQSAARGALEWLEPALAQPDALAPDEQVWAQIDAAQLHLLLGEAEAALARCERLLAVDLAEKDRVAWVCSYAEALAVCGRHQEAHDRLREALEQVSGPRAVAQIEFHRGATLRSLGRFLEAREAARRALELGRATKAPAGFLRDAWANLGFATYELGAFEEAVDALEEALRRTGEVEAVRPGILLWLGHSSLALGRAPAARRAYQAVLGCPKALEDERAAAESGLARLPAAGLRGVWQRLHLRARLLWHHLVFYGFPTTPESYHAMVGQIHFELGHYRQAIAHFERSEAARASTERGLGAYNLSYLGYAYLNLGEPEPARRCFELALRHRPDDPELQRAIEWLDRRPHPPSPAP